MAATFTATGVSWKAGGAITRYAPLKMDANGNVVVATAATDNVVGFALGDAASGEDVSVALPGQIVKAITHATLVPGDLIVASSTSGRTTKHTGTNHTHTENTASSYTQNATTAGATTATFIHLCGYAITGAAQGEVYELWFFPMKI